MRSEVWNTTMSGQGEVEKAWKTLARKWKKSERRQMRIHFPCHVQSIKWQIVFHWFKKCSAVCYHWLLLCSLKDWDWLHPKIAHSENAADTWKQWASTLAKAKKCLCKPLEVERHKSTAEFPAFLAGCDLIVMLDAYFFAVHILTCHIL